MIALRHVAFVVWSTLRFGFTTRNVVVVLIALAGLLVVLAAIGTQAAAPFVLYPFA